MQSISKCFTFGNFKEALKILSSGKNIKSFSSSKEMNSQTYLKYILTKAHCNAKKFLSVELYSSGVDTQINLNEVADLKAAFCNFTWSDRGDFSDLDSLSSIKLAKKIVENGQIGVMHLGCRNYSRDDAKIIIDKIKKIGIKNILALKGGSTLYPDDSTRDFPYALSFVKFLRSEYGDDFNIGVSGYPIGHPASPDPVKDIPYLKEKVDAGANFVFCQAVFDVETFKIFYKRCRDIGIDVPIIPGVYALDDNNVLSGGVKGFCKIIPEEYTKFFEENKDNKEALGDFSVKYISKLIKGLLNEKDINIPGVHVFCFNNFSLVKRIYESLDYDELNILKVKNVL
ncbi:5,10-methylenetetrahydrofolate reductase [Onthophagus taurus]|uniref:5,10-methylenetetrahydrofolate reductase n=1 Tax=Onthophagus taurus TaxID=166361 RepID=UPI000C20F1FB|nr:methylenetetrahydrofolate reductase [Onthophagus taurus]